MNSDELSRYYASLLIVQYSNKPKAYDTIRMFSYPLTLPQAAVVQEINFDTVPTSGSFSLQYGEYEFGPFPSDTTAEEIQDAITYYDGFEDVVVSGSFAGLQFVITLNNVFPILEFIVNQTTLENTLNEDVIVSVVQRDITLPLAVNDAFNMIGDDTAQGVNLDILAKYVGVRRTATTPEGSITLSDEDLLILMQIAIIKNFSGSSLFAIQNLLYQFFPGQMSVIDSTQMTLTYMISQEFLSTDLLNMFIYQDLLPRPMAVGISIIIFIPDFPFGFSELDEPEPDDILGFGELLTDSLAEFELSDGDELELSDGDTLEVVDPGGGSGEVDGGGSLSELIEV